MVVQEWKAHFSLDLLMDSTKLFGGKGACSTMRMSVVVSDRCSSCC